MNTLIRTSIERPADLRQLIRKHQFFIKTTPINKHQKHMKQSMHIKTIPCQQRRSAAGRTLSLLVFFALGAFAVSPPPNAFGVTPAPDGSYPGGNTAEGLSALFSLTTGTYNTAVGFFSLRSNTEGNFNTGVGAGALLLNIGDQSTREGVENTAIGTAALLSNSTGSQNTANGAFALFSNAGGGGNTATGDEALFTNTTDNTANGALAAFSTTEGRSNTAMGFEALFYNTIGIENSAFGVDALTSNTTGSDNTAIGNSALYGNTTSSSNTAVGDSALFLSTGQGNTALGAGAGTSVTTANNVIAIGHPGADVSDSCYIGNIFQSPVDPGSAVFVVIDSNGKLGTFASSKRFKEEIQPMDKASEELLALKPVTFRYKNYKNSPRQFGLIAEEVAQVNPDLVARDKNGEIYTVRYDQINAMLLNEFLKQHCTIQEQEATIERLKSSAAEQEATIAELKSTVAQQQESFQSKLADQGKQIEALASGLQKVSARVEMSSSPPRVVATNP